MKNKELNPVVMIEDDYRTLKRFAGSSGQKEAWSLSQELERAIIVRKDAFPLHTVRLHSRVSLLDTATKRSINFAIVLPEDADIGQGKISALTPIAIAIIGFRQEEEVTCKLPGGTRHFRIEKVENNLPLTA